MARSEICEHGLALWRVVECLMPYYKSTSITDVFRKVYSERRGNADPLRPIRDAIAFRLDMMSDREIFIPDYMVEAYLDLPELVRFATAS